MGYLVRLKNGKLCDYGTSGTFHVYDNDEDYYQERIKLQESYIRAEIENASQDYKNIYNVILDKYRHNGTVSDVNLKLFKKDIESLGFNFEKAKENIPIKVYSKGFSNHDCCSYGVCPLCGSSINSWMDKCGCGQRFVII